MVVIQCSFVEGQQQNFYRKKSPVGSPERTLYSCKNACCVCGLLD